MMNRPWMIWTLSGLCALLVFGAMAVITRHTMSLEKDRAKAEAKAELEERVRLALWRMDSAAAGMLVEEYSRPTWHFRDLDLGNPSPLNLVVPEKVKLHFELNNGVVSTPNENANWRSFQTLLQNDLSKEAGRSQSFAIDRLVDNNLDVIQAVAQNGNEQKMEDSAWDAQVAVAKGQRNSNTKSTVRNVKEYQSNYNRAEKVKRQAIVNKAYGNGKLQKKESVIKQSLEKKQKKKTVLPTQKVGGNQAVINDQVEKSFDKGASSSALKKDLLSSPEGAPLTLAPLTPVWLGADLVLVRAVGESSGKRVQGVWLDADVIRKSLLSDIEDLLPSAELEQVTRGLDVILGNVSDPYVDDPMVMAALPLRLLPGEVVVPGIVGWTPMRKTLGVAWIGALLAALAAVILMRGVVKLSERRASFVSSVTHELRTPLTTFSLYSDMLAEGMVQDESKRHEYLLTLRRESGRLTHLVENVLAYSHIEKGSARARVESVRVTDLVDRMCDRLQQRAEDAGMELVCELTPEIAEREVRVDTTAVEQIIFNLVDNASKYACGNDCGRLITLRVLPTCRGRGMRFQVLDQGPGVKRSEHRRLFRAFHKSAQEAAHTKPGVGLGLALSRRLARALGGDLKIIEQKQGACFELTIGSV